jgi:hypothetical protein
MTRLRILPRTAHPAAAPWNSTFIAVLLMLSMLIQAGEGFARKKPAQPMTPDQARAAIQAFGVGRYVQIKTANGQRYAGQITEIADSGFTLKTQDKQPPTTMTFEQVTSIKRDYSPQEKKKQHTFALVCLAIGIAGLIAGITSGY